MPKSLTNLINLTGVLAILILAALGCDDPKNKNSTFNATNDETKIIKGAVFPANEVCSYPKGSVLDNYGSLVMKWEESVESSDPNTRYFCQPTDKSVKIFESTNDMKVTIDYDAWGNDPKGAYRIKLEYWAWNVASNQFSVDQELRKKNLIPYCKYIADKALKTPLSKGILEKLQNPKSVTSSKGIRAKPYCEKLGQSFVCVESTMSQFETKFDTMIAFSIFASEESYQNYLDR